MPEGTPWGSQALSDDGREAFYKAALGRWESGERDTHRFGRLGLMVGAAGMLVAVLAVGAAAAVYLKTPVPPPPGYIFVDKTAGVVEQPVAAKDAAPLFPETVRDRALRDFIVACESYVPETWARLDFHACMIMATPAEQKRRADDIGRNGTRYPPTVFGPNGWAMPNAFLAFAKLGEVGVDPNQTYRYQVRYERTEVINGRETHPRYTADIMLQFHPELRITPSDRLLNPTGLQVVAFIPTRDGT